MTEASLDQLSPAELAALLSFYADAGVAWMVEDEPVDRIAEFEAQKAAHEARRKAPSAGPTGDGQPSAAPTRGAQAPARPATNAAPAMAIPDEHAVTEARFAAESARSLDELKTALEGFAGCNLKTSARSTIFASGDPTGGIMVIGGMPSGDDDRDGQAFAGRAGMLLDRMLSAIGLDRSGLLLTTIVPWRPPGDRPPTPIEAAICRPFIQRQIELAEPKHLLLLGNFTARFFFQGQETIHLLRGQWREIACDNHTVPGLACLHPLELLAAPAGKALAWQDLQDFRRRIDGKI
ncbi:uracil-DNA glycosylase [Rhizobium halophytocola]|uniref:Type-4 uracil-DNA glycosylase n=1 Tax=Rhizobium halophytocola TaxID=735519 RepID=A0ABS4DYV1_9HYPH|nr:uracil-DNA glycosylase [Rhizobium halophytocola]MBP1850868.1 DNA polymerase [Rhizobium halophytocola]